MKPDQATTIEARRKRARHLRRDRRFRLLESCALPLAAPILRLWARTWRFRFRDDDWQAFLADGGPRVVAALHGGMLMMMGLGLHGQPVGKPTTILTSPSRDGQLLAKAIRLFGYGTAVGSSAKRGVAGLRDIVDACRDGAPVLVAVDGPRGPRAEPKGGAVLAARQARAKLFVLALRGRPAIRFGSWDRLELPLPFARVDATMRLAHDYGAGPRGGDELAALRDDLRAAMESVGSELPPSGPAPPAAAKD